MHIMRKTILIPLIILCAGALIYFIRSGKTKTIWNKSYEDKVYLQFYHMVDSIMPDSDQKKVFAACAVEKLKRLLPGGPESLPADSFDKLDGKIQAECFRSIKNIKTTMPWTPQLEKLMADTFINDDNIVWKYEKMSVKIKMCHCYLGKLKKRYPKGMIYPLPDSVHNRLLIECKMEIAK
jgi:hypothetical protein